MNSWLPPLIFGALVTLSSYVWADGDGGAIVHLAEQRFLTAKEQFEKKIAQCESARTVLEPTLFKAIKLTPEQRKIALFVWHQRGYKECVKPEEGQLAVAAGIYRQTALHFGREAILAKDYTESAIFGHSWQQLDMEVKYQRMDEKQKRALEKIPGINRPFDLFKTLEGLN